MSLAVGGGKGGIHFHACCSLSIFRAAPALSVKDKGGGSGCCASRLARLVVTRNVLVGFASPLRYPQVGSSLACHIGLLGPLQMKKSTEFP